MDSNIDILKVFIADKIKERTEEVNAVYMTEAERLAQLEELRVLEQQARQTGKVLRFAKWYSGNNEIIVLESILRKVKEIERRDEKKGEYETRGK